MSSPQSGPAPLTVNWTVTTSGGTQPYNLSTNTSDGSPIYYGTYGSHTWVLPGIYQVWIFMTDAGTACEVGTGFDVKPYGTGGPNPATFQTNTTHGPVPLAVQYSVNLSGAPAGAVIEWYCFSSDPNGGPGSFYGVEEANGTRGNCTFYDHGPAYAYIFVYYPNGIEFWEGYGPQVNVTGTTLITLEAVGSGSPSPASGQFWVNLTNPSALPAGANLSGQIYTTPSLRAGCPQNPVWNPPWTFNVTFGTALPWGPFDYDPCGVNWYDIQVDVRSASNVTIFVEQVYVIVSPTPAQNPSPVVALGVFPSNGTSPLNVTFQLSATGSWGPFSVQLGIEGAGGFLANGTPLDAFFYNATNWSGAVVNVTHTFLTGNYTIDVFVTNTISALAYSQAFVTVSNPTPVPPLAVVPTVPAPSPASTGSLSFEVTISGGRPPYSILWSFGDGSVGSSISGTPITHEYAAGGNYSVDLNVADANGVGFNGTWTVVVPFSAHPSSPASTTPAAPNFSPLVESAALLAALLVLMVGYVRYRSRVGARRLVDRLERESEPETPEAPPTR